MFKRTFFLMCQCMLFLIYLYHFGLCYINNNVFAWIDGCVCVHMCVVCMCVCVGVYTCVWGLGVYGSQWSTSWLTVILHLLVSLNLEQITQRGLSASALPLPRLQMGPTIPSDSPDLACEEALYQPCCLSAQIIRYLKKKLYIPHVLQPLERKVQINSDSDS